MGKYVFTLDLHTTNQKNLHLTDKAWKRAKNLKIGQKMKLVVWNVRDLCHKQAELQKR